MDYVLRRVTDEDEVFFDKSGIKSPWGGSLGSSYYMVESVKEDVKMMPIGGQGIMEEDGTEWSEMASYCAIVWKGKSYRVEFYSHSNCIRKAKDYEIFVMTYKIKEVQSEICNGLEKEEFIKIAKKCFESYGAGGCKTSLCEKVIFIDTEVRWV